MFDAADPEEWRKVKRSRTILFVPSIFLLLRGRDYLLSTIPYTISLDWAIMHKLGRGNFFLGHVDQHTLGRQIPGAMFAKYTHAG